VPDTPATACERSNTPSYQSYDALKDGGIFEESRYMFEIQLFLPGENIRRSKRKRKLTRRR
jgi:hypothetical protein